MRNCARWFRLVAILAFLTATISGTPGSAQVRVPPAARADIEQLVHEGEQLENSGRWGDALTLYEDALRAHPAQRDLELRAETARLHLDLSRRCSDASFTAALNELNDQQWLDLYTEVLLKIHSHYVQAPDWQQVVERGILALEVAAKEPEFREQHSTAGSPQFQRYLVELRQKLKATPIQNRQQAREFASYAGRLAAHRGQLNARTVYAEFACAATNCLDPYSAFLTRGQLDEVFSQIEGNFVGLGIELKSDEQALLIVNVIPGGPAADADIRDGDRIVAVDGHSVHEISTDTAADMLKGEEGTPVSLEVVNDRGVTRSLHLSRKRVEVPSVEDVKIVDPQNGIAYLRITSFQKTTNRDVDRALWELHRAGMRSLIMDLRGNPGGLLSSSVEVADKFIGAGTIVSTRGRSFDEDFDYKAQQVGTWRVPLIVLIDGDSASASEIFAGAIRDHRRGTIVGQRSYGKGSVQGIFPLASSNGGIRLTTAKFYSPSGQPISQRGVSPDVVVHTTAKPAPESVVADPDQERDDPYLKAGLQVARQQLTRK